ncbi:MAG TPA: HDIG domain-containing protein [Planctomycetota bacterium]|nr:HDIG domain-containing protein [Planctomycetota bacterium]
MSELMSREAAIELVTKHVKNKNLRKHMLATEAVMRALAKRLGEDETLWAFTGLVHDVDWDETAEDFANHGIISANRLAELGCPDVMVHAVKAHAEKAPIETKLDRALHAADPLTGFLVSCALIRPEKKLAIVDVSFVRNRMGEKGFSRAVSRDQIRECEQLDVPLDEFIGLCLDAMKSISGDLGL